MLPSKITTNYKYTLFKNNFKIDTNLKIYKHKTVSNGSRNYFKLKLNFPSLRPSTFFIKNFFWTSKASRGRLNGSVVCRTKSKLLKKNKYPIINNNVRNSSLSFLSGFFLNPLKFKIYSSFITSSGQVYYTFSTTKHSLFQVSKLYSFFKNQKILKFAHLTKLMKLPKIFYFIFNLPKYKFVSSIEILPNKGSQYVRSPGSKSIITKVDIKTSLAVVKLPSGVNKAFSIYSSANLGTILFNNKTLKTRPNAGFFKKQGVKSLSRGVAKNPVDHPHGGRNKAIRYQRTPWGKTTKYK